MEPTGEIHQQRKAKKEICALPKELWGMMAKTMDINMLKNPVFVLYGLSCILCMAGMISIEK